MSGFRWTTLLSSMRVGEVVSELTEVSDVHTLDFICQQLEDLTLRVKGLATQKSALQCESADGEQLQEVYHRAVQLFKSETPLRGQDNPPTREINAWFRVGVPPYTAQELRLTLVMECPEGDILTTSKLFWLERSSYLWQLDIEETQAFPQPRRTVGLWTHDSGLCLELKRLSGFRFDNRGVEPFLRDLGEVMLDLVVQACGEEDDYGVPIGLRVEDLEQVLWQEPITPSSPKRRK